MKPEHIQSCAAQIDHARTSRELLRPFSSVYPEMTLNDAYAVQSAWVKRRTTAGQKVIGHKIGLTSKAMQAASAVREPDYGAILDGTVFDDGVDIAAGTFVAPAVELELTFVMKSHLLGPCTIFDVLNATEYVIPSIELLDSRFQRIDSVTGKPRTLIDNVCDNAGNSGLILGGRAVRPTDVDLRWTGAMCMRNGQVEETGLAAGVLGDPARSVSWLANRLARHDVAVEPGQLLLSGSFIRVVPIQPGDTITGDFGPLGTVSCHFS